jgi:hypothetical protein
MGRGNADQAPGITGEGGAPVSCRMPRTRPPNPPAFLEEAVRLIRAGQKFLPEISKDLGRLTRLCATGCSRQRSTGNREGMLSVRRPFGGVPG